MTVKRNDVILLVLSFMVGILLSFYFLKSLGYPTNAEADMILEHNLIRENSGRPLFELDEDLMDRAQKHSEAMATRRRLYHGHTSPGEAENIGAGYKLTVSGVIKMWLASPNHRRNIFGPYTKMGWGFSKRGDTYYYTVIFKSH